jgi:hypothetical protein
MKHCPPTLPVILLAHSGRSDFLAENAETAIQRPAIGKQLHDPDAMREFRRPPFRRQRQVKYRSARRGWFITRHDSSEIDGRTCGPFSRGPDLEASARTARVMAKEDSVLLGARTSTCSVPRPRTPATIAACLTVIIRCRHRQTAAGRHRIRASTMQGVGGAVRQHASTLVLHRRSGRYIPRETS